MEEAGSKALEECMKLYSVVVVDPTSALNPKIASFYILDSAHSPLETAYIWVLSIKSAITGDLTFFLYRPFTFKCKQIQARRVFDASLFSEENCFMYHGLLERNGSGTHPRADLFFITGDKELVLVGIAEGNE